MLRQRLGDEVFWKSVRRYLEAHAHRIVETNDLMRALETESGVSMEEFFDQWVYRPGHPALKVKIAYERGYLSVGVQQTQKGTDVAVFTFPLEVEIGWGSGKTERREKLVSERSDALVVPLKDRPAWVAFDPSFRVVGDVTVEAPADLLLAQLKRGRSARARWLAATALSKRFDETTIAALGAVLGNQKESWMVRAEVARALGTIGAHSSYELLEPALSTPHPTVRRAVASALGEFRTGEATRALGRIAKKDPSYLVEAEAARALGRTRRPEALKVLRQVVDHPSWADVKRAAALEALGTLREDSALPDLLQRTRYGVPTRGRIAAIAAVAASSEEKKAREHLQRLLDDADPYLRISVVRALEVLGSRKSRGPLRRRLDRELDGRVGRSIREALRNLTTADASDRKQLGDDLESLRREVRELKLKLDRIEQVRPEKKRGRHK
jgi:aminopeptidase N